jgi:flagellar motor switch protein FliM
MNEITTVESYAFQEAEQLRLGRFPVLDTILYRWARQIEETLFEQFHLEMYAGASVVEEMKFSAFYASLKSPKPIYFFEMDPVQGQALLVLDNRFANLCVSRVGEDGPVKESDRLTLAPHNQGRLQRVVSRMMRDFERSWADVQSIRMRLQKVSTFLFRARILNPYERCLVAQIHLSGENVSARLTWCFPRVMLDPLLKELEMRRVIPSLVPERGSQMRFTPAALDGMDYRLSVSLGRLDPRGGSPRLEPGAVIPLRQERPGQAIVSLNGKPVLLGTVGESDGRYAIRVSGPYSEAHGLPVQRDAAFREVAWPAS